jgi:hypothetical protein
MRVVLPETGRRLPGAVGATVSATVVPLLNWCAPMSNGLTRAVPK